MIINSSAGEANDIAENRGIEEVQGSTAVHDSPAKAAGISERIQPCHIATHRAILSLEGAAVKDSRAFPSAPAGVVFRELGAGIPGPIAKNPSVAQGQRPLVVDSAPGRTVLPRRAIR